jgi:hypothetical protein
MDDRTVPVLAVGVALTIAALLGGIIVGQAALGVRPFMVMIPALPLVVVLIWKRPWITAYVALAAGLLIELFSYTVGSHDGPVTAKLPIFRSFGGGVVVLPIEVLFFFGLLIWLMRAGLTGRLDLPKSAFAKALVAFWFLLLLSFAIGWSRGGEFNIALWEMRPWMLLTAAYLLTSTLLRTRNALNAILWVLVICTGFKGVQGTYMFLAFARKMSPRPETILSHEESVFFGIFIILTVGLWVFGLRGRLRTTATALFPFVLIADLANSRRTAWPIVLIGLCVLLAITWVTHSEKRKFVGPVLVLMIVFCMFYFPLYWNKTNGTLAQPARAVRSTISPDPRDEASNLYRDQENANLVINIQQAGKLGKGFGLPINYVLPIADVSMYDSMIKFIPHNGLLWIWMRMGVQGEIAFWILVGTAMIAAARVTRSKDDLIALFGTVVTCGLFAYVVQGYEDLGFANLRVAIVLGCLIGGVETATRLMKSDDADAEKPELETLGAA